MLATHTLVWTLLDTQEDQGTGCASRGDPEEPDDQDNEDDEDTEEDEEDKGDGGTHATVVADLHETMKPQGERKALEKDKTRRTRRRRRRRRWRRPRREEEEKEAEYLHRKIRGKSALLVSKERRPRNPTPGARIRAYLQTYLPQVCREHKRTPARKAESVMGGISPELG